MTRSATSIFFLLVISSMGTATNSIRIENSSVTVRDTSFFYVRMDNDQGVNGFNFIIRFDPKLIRPSNIRPVGRAAAVIGSVGYAFSDDGISFILFDRQGSSILPDTGRVFEVSFTSNDSTLSSDSTTQVVFSQGTAADSNYITIPFAYANGQITVRHLTDVKGPVVGLPEQYQLYQNYPNPFNPTTTIKYNLPVTSRVSMRLYNILGQEVRTLTNEVQTAGLRAVVWDSRNDAGNNVATGAYFYRLEAKGVGNPRESFLQVKKMLIIK